MHPNRLRVQAGLMRLLVAVFSLLCAGEYGGLKAQPKKAAEAPVAFQVTNLKITATGTYTLTLVVKIRSGWFMYGNPIGHKDAEEEQLEVKVPGASGNAVVKYPAGQVIPLTRLGGYSRIYKGTLMIPVRFQAPRDKNKPLAITVTYYATPENRCNVLRTVRLPLPKRR